MDSQRDELTRRLLDARHRLSADQLACHDTARRLKAREQGLKAAAGLATDPRYGPLGAFRVGLAIASKPPREPGGRPRVRRRDAEYVGSLIRQELHDHGRRLRREHDRAGRELRHVARDWGGQRLRRRTARQPKPRPAVRRPNGSRSSHRTSRRGTPRATRAGPDLDDDESPTCARCGAGGEILSSFACGGEEVCEDCHEVATFGVAF
jgi:hypothetical protein